MRLIVLCFYLLSLVGCTKENQPQQQDVLQLHQDDKVLVSISPANAPVEEILSWTIKLSGDWKIKHAEVTGLSMSMGTIPLQFKAVAGDGHTYTTEMVLGACTQPRMQWQLQLTLLHATQGEHMVLLPFYSSWPE